MKDELEEPVLSLIEGLRQGLSLDESVRPLGQPEGIRNYELKEIVTPESHVSWLSRKGGPKGELHLCLKNLAGKISIANSCNRLPQSVTFS